MAVGPERGRDQVPDLAVVAAEAQLTDQQIHQALELLDALGYLAELTERLRAETLRVAA
jgi:hypothetical protein